MFPLRDYRPSGIVPYATYFLLAANVAVYLYQWWLGAQPGEWFYGLFRLGDGQTVLAFSEAFHSGLQRASADLEFTNRFGAMACKVLAECPSYRVAGGLMYTALSSPLPAWATLFSSMFMHGGLMHLGGNMLYLWIFGDNIEAAMGRARFLAFYLVCGLAAALAQMGIDPTSSTPLIGASGAISGVLAAYLFMFPRSGVLTLVWFVFLVRLVVLPASVILGVWFLIQLFSALGATDGGGVAFMAHVGGFVAGAVLYRAFRRRVEVVGSAP